jgi:hypothetical protein
MLWGREVAKELTFSSVEFNHIQSESNLLKRIVFLGEGNATLE